VAAIGIFYAIPHFGEFRNIPCLKLLIDVLFYKGLLRWGGGRGERDFRATFPTFMLYMKKYPAAGGLSQACPILGTACHADYAESTLGSLSFAFLGTANSRFELSSQNFR
jgi:hypothetical protein